MCSNCVGNKDNNKKKNRAMDFRAIQVYSLMYLCQQNHIRNNDSKYRLLFIFSLLKRYLSLYIYIYITPTCTAMLF